MRAVSHLTEYILCIVHIVFLEAKNFQVIQVYSKHVFKLALIDGQFFYGVVSYVLFNILTIGEAQLTYIKILNEIKINQFLVIFYFQNTVVYRILKQLYHTLIIF
ncbi:Hypothetical_protein [Hexamita inflata]|uniref:Hypothetical_protein n=1 Tax=Hexamita inflata TaxID=28002 RepID=A0AA86NLB4_9EUKA|nr:Hypothetical protein HINF_LOCUS8962 [Hexamita inflata]